MELTNSQKNLISIVKRVCRYNENSISVGPNETDAFGRKLTLEGQFVEQGKLKKGVLELIDKIKNNQNKIETILQGEVMWYDVRSSVWMENPELSALFALAYATVLVDRTGKKTGHTLNIAIDCYKKHHESMSAFVDTIIRTGIFKDGGGIVYWGIQNGGAIRNLSQFEKATTNNGGNWVYGTMSHRSEDYLGAKFGMLGKVFCGPDLREDLYKKLVSASFVDLEKIDRPEEFVINVGNITANNIDVLEDLIRARTGTKKLREDILKGLKIGMNMCGSPVGKNLLDILRAFGADVLAENSELNENFSTSNIVDPNEHDSKETQRMKALSIKNRHIYLSVDPDGDRGTIIALDPGGCPISLTGTELLLLAMENLATYNPEKLPNDVIYDMRTGVSVSKFAKVLNDSGHNLKIIASEPGYPFFMELMGENRDAVVAVENTCHPFLTPYTNRIWGAPKQYDNIQGGDDASIFLIYILALSNLLWDGRNPVAQLKYLQKKYNIPQTIIREFKPSVDKIDALKKYDIAEEMSKIAENNFDKRDFIIDTMNSGVRISRADNNAMVLIRYSNTGPSFTASSEAINKKMSEEMLRIGGAIMNLAVLKVKKERGDFGFEWNDFSNYGEISTEESENLLKNHK